MKRTGRSRSRRKRYSKVLSRALPGKPVFTLDGVDIISDLDPGVLAWRARR